MFEKNHLLNEISSLLINGEAEFEVKGKPPVGQVAWAKTVLNKMFGLDLPINNSADTNFRKAIEQFQTKNSLAVTTKLDFQTERALLEKYALFNLTDLDKEKKEVIEEAKTKIEDYMDEAIKRVNEIIRAEEPQIPAMIKEAEGAIRKAGKITEESEIQKRAKNIVAGKLKKNLITNEFRDPRRIWALVLHHMAVKSPDEHGNYSNPKKYLGVGAHFCIMFDGRIIQLHPISRMLWHANGTSPNSVGVEFEGNFADINGNWWYERDKKTKKIISRNEDRPTSAQYESGRFLLKYLKYVMDIKHVLAHRQSSGDRDNDPGPDVWFNVGEWGLVNLSLSDGGKSFKVGTGNPIPNAWRTWGNRNHEIEPGEGLSISKTASHVSRSENKERIIKINGENVRFAWKNPGWAAYGGGNLKAKLLNLKQRGSLSISLTEIETFAITSIPESGGLVNAINSWDTAYMSMGFFQFPVKFNKLQRVIKKAPDAFRKHGIELDMTRTYVVDKEKSFAIKNAAEISDLRSFDWAVRFFEAGLEDDVIIAQIEVAREILNSLLKNYDKTNYLNRFKNSYPTLWAFIFEANNSRPAILQMALIPAIKKATDKNVNDVIDFVQILKDALLAATEKFYNAKQYDKDPAKNEIKKNKRVKEELAKVARIVKKIL
jgi:N-acetyl-anhydromuramyl-L-alanine amidase AmpD